MDTIYCSRRLLLWTVLIILLKHCQEVSASSLECPQGQLLHWHNKAVHSRPQYITCCYPTRCGVGEQVKPCQINGTQDTCQMCSAYQNQSLRTSSYTMEPCTYWPLDKDCKNIDRPPFQRNIDDERTRRCMCNIELGKRFMPPESEYPGAPMDSYCQRRSVVCKEGMEPVVNGDCTPCRDNYFKSTVGFKLCEPATNCTLLGLKYISYSNSKNDSVCSEPDPVTTPKQAVIDTLQTITPSPRPPVTSGQSMTAVMVSTPEDTARSGKVQDVDKNDSSFPWPILIVVLFLLILVGLIGFILLWRKRKGMSVWVCASSKNCSDPEKNYTQGSSSMLGDDRGKHNLGENCVIPQHWTDGDKIINNNVNGGLPCGLGYIPNGHPNGNVRHAHFSQPEPPSGDTRSYFVAPLQYRLVPTSRPGILMNSTHNVVYGQAQGNVRDRSIDSIGQEKLQVHVDELEANQDIGENDPLLVADHLHGVSPCQIQNLAASVGNSPPVIQAGVNPLHLLAYGGQARSKFGPTFVHSGASSPPVQAQGPVVTYAPAAGAVTFTRSTSVIASPEGEVDEEEIEARLPRLSQLLTEGENSSVGESHQVARDVYRADSPGRETTQQLRAPSQRLTKDHYNPPKIGHPNNQQPRYQGNHTTQRPGFPPAVVEPVLQRDFPISQHDHRIMNLKEQQLAESLHSSSHNPFNNGQQNVVPYLSATDAPKTVVSSPEEAHQTELKTRHPAAADSDLSTSASANAKVTKEEQDTNQTTELKQIDNGKGGQNLFDRKRQVSGGSNGQNNLEEKHLKNGAHFQNVSERKRVPSGGSNSSGQSTLERQRAPSGDQQRPCLKNSLPDEADNTSKRRYNRTVSFEEDESPQPGNRQHGTSSESRQSSKSGHSPEKSNPDLGFKGPLRSLSDPEQKNIDYVDSDDEETERKCVSLEFNASNGSSKTSVSSDISGTDSSNGSLCRTALYRRSQSENAPSSSESCHKPPPRSMSEEKPQKLDRPIAKVKPMPASDNAVNQLPVELSDEASVSQEMSPAAVYTSSAAGNVGYGSDDSDQENNRDNSEAAHSTTPALEEDELESSDDTEDNRV